MEASARRRQVAAGLAALPMLAAADRPAQRRFGFDLIETSAAPLGSAAAAASLARMRALGASVVALIPFLWQPRPDSPDIVMGDALPPERLRAGVRQARAAGLRVLVKPQVWVPGAWAGAVDMGDDAGWRRWFARYAAALLPLATLAQAAGAESLAVGTELAHTSARPEWRPLIARVRRVFHGPLTYMAHGAEETERVAFWPALDRLGVTLYPALGPTDAPAAWRTAMTAERDRVLRVARAVRREVWVGEVGLRSAQGATLKPWESAEERAAPADPQLQARVLDAWLDVLDAPAITRVLVWRWFSDPAAGGAADTDFTVQNKPAQAALAARFRRGG
ncbi:MAG: glycosidase-like protein [Caulobacteraceae bacterium]|nr:glycosidase-like protein [Caulobacter sp.]